MNTRLKLIAAIFVLLTGGLLSRPTLATPVALDFGSLPSAQGWAYVPYTAASETSVFSVSGGVLLQDTIGLPYGTTPGGNRYEFYDVVSTSQPFVINITARVLEYEGIAPFTNGFSFGLFTGTEAFIIGLTTNSITDPLLNVLPLAIDNTIFHDFRLTGTPGVGWELFVDGVSVGSGAPRPRIYPNQLILGDSTGGGNARAEVTSYTNLQ